MKPLVLSATIFTASLAGATAVGVVTSKPRPSVQHEQPADSSEATDTTGQTAPHDAPTPAVVEAEHVEPEPAPDPAPEPVLDDVASAPDGGAHAEAVDTASAGAATAGPAPAVAADAPSPDIATVVDSTEVLREAAYQELARVFAAMQPRQAAGVLARMPDRDVVRILRALNARKAGAVLASLPQERAAQISRQLLEPTQGGSDR